MNRNLTLLVKLILPCLLLLLTTYTLVQFSVHSLYVEKENNLRDLSSILRQTLLSTPEIRQALQTDDAAAIKTLVQPYLDNLVVQGSTVSASVFLADTHALVAYAPRSAFVKDKTQNGPVPQQFQTVLATGEPSFSKIDPAWRNESLYNYATPLQIDGKIVALLNFSLNYATILEQTEMVWKTGLTVCLLALLLLVFVTLSTERRLRRITDERDVLLQFERKQKRNILDQLPLGVLLFDPEGNVIHVNPHVSELLGHSQEELLSWQTYDWRSRYHLLNQQHVSDMLRAGQQIEGDLGFFLHKSGKEIPFSLSARTLKHDNGEPFGHLLIYNDLSNQFALNRLEQKTHLLFDAIPLLLLDAEQRIEYISPTVCELLGKGEHELLGELLQDSLTWEFPAGESSLCDQVSMVLATGMRSRLVNIPCRMQGREYHLEFNLFPIFNPFNQETDGCMMLIKDVSLDREWSELSQQVDANASYVQMAATIAHEVRNPMTSVRGFLQLLAGNELADQQRMYIDVMRMEIDRMNAILSEYLSMARPLQPERARLDLSDLLRETFLLLEGEANYRGVSLTLDSGDGGAFEGIARELKQVLINLARNAFDALPANQGAIRISLRVVDDAFYTIDVQDNGCGIPPEKLSRVFDPFFTTKAMGTGLGLAVCKKIVEAHGGTLTVASQAGVGTTFTVSLPKT